MTPPPGSEASIIAPTASLFPLRERWLAWHILVHPRETASSCRLAARSHWSANYLTSRCRDCYVQRFPAASHGAVEVQHAGNPCLPTVLDRDGEMRSACNEAAWSLLYAGSPNFRTFVSTSSPPHRQQQATCCTATLLTCGHLLSA